MVFECDNNISALYDSHFSLCCDILTDFGIDLTPKLLLELHAVFFIVSDFTAFAANHNRKAVSDEVLNTVFKKLASIHRPLPTQEFRKRINFYSSVVSGQELHAHALMGQDVSDTHPVLQCVIAFADCCLNPSYIDNYNSPAPVLSALDVFEFSTDVMEPLYHVFISYCDALYDCSVSANSDSTKIPGASNSIKDSSNTPQVASVKESKRKISTSTLILFFLFAIAIIAMIHACNSALSSDSSSISTSQVPTTVTTEPTESLTRLPTPANGKIILSTKKECVAPLSVKATTYDNCYLVLTEHGTTKIIMSFFVRADCATEVSVPAGTFDIYYAVGEAWYGTEHLFGDSTHRAKFHESFHFTKGSGWEIEMHPVTYGNLGSDSVSAADFPN